MSALEKPSAARARFTALGLEYLPLSASWYARSMRVGRKILIHSSYTVASRRKSLGPSLRVCRFVSPNREMVASPAYRTALTVMTMSVVAPWGT